MRHPILAIVITLVFGEALVLNSCYLLTPSVMAQDSGGIKLTRVADAFDSHIAPLLVSNCLECHSGTKPEGGLSLAAAQLAAQGGDSGPSFVPNDADASLLWQRVASDEMPPSHPLSNEDKEKLQQWLASGAVWGTSPIDRFAHTTSTRAGRDWWALQSLRLSEHPDAGMDLLAANALADEATPHESSNHLHPIDDFVLAGLRTAGLEPSPLANPRELVRRVYFDLIGLPPTPQQVAAFTLDPSLAAYERIVDGLLASQHYGERWGRHWLDVVRFGESDGFERNFPRDHAWPYRDWIINSLNQDMPYDEFVRQQLMGDVVPGGVDGMAAAGFWTAGLHNTVVGGSQRMKQLARQDEIEDVLATIGQTFLGLTINCARCHDHKYDPISQTEFYQLASAISGLGFGERVLTSEPARLQLEQLDASLRQAQDELSTLEQMARQAILAAKQSQVAAVAMPPTAVARWEFDNDLRDHLGTLHGSAHGNVHFEAGAVLLDGESFVVTPPLATNIRDKSLEVWVQLDNLEQAGGAAMSIEAQDGSAFDAIVFAERDPQQWLAGSNSFVRTDSFDGPQETTANDRPVHLILVYHADGSIQAYRDGAAYGHAIAKSPLHTYPAGETELLFGLRHKPPGGNRFIKAKLHRAAFYDRALTSAEVIAARDSFPDYVSEIEIVDWLDAPQREQRDSLKRAIAELGVAREQQLALAKRTVYTLVPGQGETTRVLSRGDPDLADTVVAPRPLEVFAHLGLETPLPPDAPEAERRRQLAQWIAHRDNPLFARVMVNRMWHYHFGTGIVDTPNDFGFNGGRPTHPELLDYLAEQFIAHEFRLKPLHRLIVTSVTYRQAAQELPDELRGRGEAIDAENRLLWRGPLRRLEAETLRDAMLSVAGQLNVAAGGPSFKDVSVVENNGTTYYEPIDAVGAAVWRRTVYRFNPRGGRSALLDTFDCPDPAAAAPRRAVTTTPLQSLSLLNNVFVLRMADAMAERVINDVGVDPARQVDLAWQLAIAREPTPVEQPLSLQLVEQHGLPALCRGLFNFNEFVIH